MFMTLRYISIVCLLAAVSGCGGDDLGLVSVSGTVRMDGEPLSQAKVIFTPVQPAGDSPYTGAQSAGITDEQGHFRLATLDHGRGAIVGTHSVSISKSSAADADVESSLVEGEDASSDSDIVDEREIAVGLVPATYNRNTTLTFTVPPEGTDQANFDLTGGRSRSHRRSEY